MNRATARTILRRRLKDVPGVLWSDTDLNTLLDEALFRVQTRVMACRPNAFLSVRTTNLVSGQRDYPIPSGMWHEIEVGVSDSSQPQGYRTLERNDYWKLREYSTGFGPTEYARFGNYFYISPAPQASVTNGLRVIIVPALSWSDDSTIPPLHIGLHMAVVYWAQVLAFGETDESTEDIRKVLERLEVDIPTYYLESGGVPDRIDLPAKDY